MEARAPSGAAPSGVAPHKSDGHAYSSARASSAPVDVAPPAPRSPRESRSPRLLGSLPEANALQIRHVTTSPVGDSAPRSPRGGPGSDGGVPRSPRETRSPLGRPPSFTLAAAPEAPPPRFRRVTTSPASSSRLPLHRSPGTKASEEIEQVKEDLRAAKLKIHEQDLLLGQQKPGCQKSGPAALEAEIAVLTQSQAAMRAEIKRLEDKVEQAGNDTRVHTEEEARLRLELASLGLAGALESLGLAGALVNGPSTDWAKAIKEEKDARDLAKQEADEEGELMGRGYSEAVKLAATNAVRNSGSLGQSISFDHTTPPIRFTRPYLRVSIERAEFIKNTDVLFGHKADPYCVCRIMRDGKPKGAKIQTEVASARKDRAWYCTEDAQEWEAGDDLEFTVMSQEYESDELVGSVTLPSEEIRGGGFRGSLDLSKEGERLATCVQLKVQIMLDRHTELRRWPPQVSQAMRSIGEVPPVMVSVFGAKGLQRQGECNPSCVCLRPNGGGQAFKTAVIRCSLDPNWNHIGEKLQDWLQEDEMIFRVIDQGEVLGEARLAFADFFPDGFSGSIPLLCDNAHLPSAGGASLHLQVERSSPNTGAR